MSQPTAGATLFVTVRTAASVRIGAGHAARTVAVAHELSRIGAEVRWVCDEDTVPFLIAREVSDGCIRIMRRSATMGKHGELQARDDDQRIDAAETLEHSGELTDWLLVDSYQLGTAWQRAARAGGARVAAFDDLADRPLDADLVINAAAVLRQYDSLAPGARILDGLRHAITGDPLRPPAAGPGTLLLSFGAADPTNQTEAVLRALAVCVAAGQVAVPTTLIQLGIGAAFRDRVARLVATLRWSAFAPDGPTSPGSPKLAIGAAGVSLLERMRAGIPSVVLVAAPNQRALAEAAVHAGAAVGAATPKAACELALALLSDPATLERMSLAGKDAVDGRGAARVAREMNRMTGVDLRIATMDDAELLHRWRNHPTVRVASHTTDPIPWETHVQWLAASLMRDDRHVLVAERRGCQFGTLRFDIAGNQATVSIAVDPSRHGSGIGPAILDAGERWLRSHDGRVRHLRAEIRAGNEASVRAFRAAGYLGGPTTFERAIGSGSNA